MSSTLPGSQSPAPSFASKESFATAQEDSPVISGLLSPPQTLRKSVSVDSFVSYKAQQHEHPTSPRKLFAITQAPTHSRDSSDTSDEDLSSRSQQRGQMSPGELLLPSRTPASPTVASDGVQRIASASSLPTYVPKRSIPVALAGRARSGSLGIYLPSSEKTSQVHLLCIGIKYLIMLLCIAGQVHASSHNTYCRWNDWLWQDCNHQDRAEGLYLVRTLTYRILKLLQCL